MTVTNALQGEGGERVTCTVSISVVSGFIFSSKKDLVSIDTSFAPRLLLIILQA